MLPTHYRANMQIHPTTQAVLCHNAHADVTLERIGAKDQSNDLLHIRLHNLLFTPQRFHT